MANSTSDDWNRLPVDDGKPSDWVIQTPEGATMTQAEKEATLRAQQFAERAEAAAGSTYANTEQVRIWYSDISTWRTEIEEINIDLTSRYDTIDAAVAATAADRVQTGQDRAQTSADRAAAANSAQVAASYDPAPFQAHLANKANPHETTAAQVGLGNVDNTSDVNKPLSTAATNALAGKQNTLMLPTQAQAEAGALATAGSWSPQRDFQAIRATSRVMHDQGGDENSGLSTDQVVRLISSFVAVSPLVLAIASCSLRTITNNEAVVGFAAVGIWGVTEGALMALSTEQVLTYDAAPAGVYRTVSRSVAGANLVPGRTYQIRLLLRATLTNRLAPSGMVVSGVNT